MKRLLFFLMALPFALLTACGSVESNSDSRLITSPPTPTLVATFTPKSASEQIASLGLTATVEVRGSATKSAQVTGTAAATQTQIAATQTQQWVVPALTSTGQAIDKTAIDQEKARNDVTADKAKKDAEVKAAAAKAEAEAKIAAEQAKREEIFNKAINQALQTLIEAMPIVISVIVLLAFCILGALGVLWLVHYSRDREQERKDASARRRLSKNVVDGRPAYYNDNGWHVLDNTPPALPAPIPLKQIKLPEAEIEKRCHQWDTAAWKFCYYAEQITNAKTGERGSFTVNDMVHVYSVVTRTDWDELTKLLMNSGVLIKDSDGTRYGTDDNDMGWTSNRVRSAFLTKQLKVAYPVDKEGNVLPPPTLTIPTVAVPVRSEEVEAVDTHH